MSKRRPVFFFIAISVWVFAALAVGLFLRGGERFQMSLTVTGGDTYVQFIQPGHRVESDPFPIELPGAVPQTVALYSADSIPGCQIEFMDLTLMPGRVKVRIGRQLFDVMVRAVVVDGVDNAWHPRKQP